jgi:predicted amidohydrolase YtcJ
VGKYRAIVGVLLLKSALSWGASDLILEHGHIFTSDPRQKWAQAIAVTGSSIDRVGSDQSVASLRGPKTRVIDLKGRTVIPGIIDAHAHTLYGSYALHGFNLSTPEASITPDKPGALVAAIKSFAAAHPEDPILFGRADFSATPPTTPTRELLDRAVPDRPVIVHNTSEHSVWINSAAMAMSGLTEDPVADADEEKGVVRDGSGRPTGVLLEAAMQIAARGVDTRLDDAHKLAMLRDGLRELNRNGVTAVVNATGDLAEIRLYATLRDRGELTLRTRTAFGAVAVRHHLTPKFLADLEAARTTYHDKWVSANLVKFFADGGTGLIPPLVYTAKEYRELIFDLDSKGYQIMTHATRYDTIHMVLDTYEALERAHGVRDRRLRVEHLDQAAAADVPRFAQLGVLPVMEVSFCCSSSGFNFNPADNIDSDRWQSVDVAGALALGSDWPCTWPPSPFVALEQARTRAVWRSADTDPVAGQPLDGAAQGGARMTGETYVPNERLSVEDAVIAYTRGSAHAAFFDAWTGSLEKGKEADLVILSQDIFSAPSEALSATQVVLTMVGGKTVYGSPP